MDFDSRLGRKTLNKLKRESMVWLTTVDTAGRPQPRPVWFPWAGQDVLTFSLPDAAKVRQIAANAKRLHSFQRGQGWHRCGGPVGEGAPGQSDFHRAPGSLSAQVPPKVEGPAVVPGPLQRADSASTDSAARSLGDC